MRKFIPKFLKYPLITLYIFIRCILRGSSTKNITLNLAAVLPKKGVVHGGKVKLLHLRERFGDTWKNFNIAYFVSSGLPFASKIWLLLYKLFGIKIVWNQNGVAYPAWAGDKTLLVNNLMSPIHLSNYVIYQSKFCQRSADKYLGTFKGPTSIIYNPVDTRHFTPRKTPLATDYLTIIMAGNHLESEERLLVAIEAIKKLREGGENIKLIIIGNLDKNFEEKWIEKRGSYLQKDAPSLFQSAHILLHLKYLDPCPTIVLEALACSLPVIGLRNGGMPELVDEHSGILIPVTEDFEKLHYPTTDEIVEAIKKIQSDYQKYSSGARESVLKFDKEQWLKKHEEIFQKLCQ